MGDKVIRIDLDSELDLHHFHPKDAKMVLIEFIDMAVLKGIKAIRIVHGKGRSVIKEIVRSELNKNVNVISYNDEPGNWGATIAILIVN